MTEDVYKEGEERAEYTDEAKWEGREPEKESEEMGQNRGDSKE